MVRPDADVTAELAPDERDREIGTHGTTEHVTGVGVQPGRNVDGDDGTTRRIDGRDAVRRPVR